jgi:hypothetical protein
VNLVGDEPAAVGRHLIASEAAVAKLAGRRVAGIPILHPRQRGRRSIRGVELVLIDGVRHAVVVVVGIELVRDMIAVVIGWR